MVPPIYATSTFIQDKVGEARGGYEYSAPRIPTRTALEECMAALEGGKHGLAFASGLAAEDTLLRTIASPGSHFVVPDDAYGGTYRLFARVHQRWGIAADPAHLTNLDTVAAAITPGETTAVWIETPDQPAAQHCRHRRDRRPGARGRRARHRRQHALPRRTFSSRWSLVQTSSCIRRRSTAAGTPTSSAARWCVNDDELAEQLRFHQNAIGGVAEPIRLLARAARPANVGGADGAALRQRRAGGGLSE